MASKIDRLDTENLIRRYRAGESGIKLAKEIMVKPETFYRWLHSKKIVASQNLIDRQEIGETVKQRYLSGESAKSIGDDVGINHWTVIQWLKRQGIKVRTQSDAECLKWFQMVSKKRTQQVKAAHDATRGSQRTLETRIKVAQGMYRNQSIRGVGSHRELELMKWLGGSFKWQYPIGPYNVDFAVAELRVAVELQCGEFGRKDRSRHCSVRDERLEYIFNAGWRVLICSIIPNKIIEWPIIAEKCLAFANFIRSNPAVGGQYGMVGGNGQPIAHRGFNHEKWARVPGF